MLVLRRAKNERIQISGPCEIVVTQIGRGWVKVGIVADREVTVMRSEIADRSGTEADGKDGDSSRQGGCGE